MKIAPKVPPLDAHNGTLEIVAADGTGSRVATASTTMQTIGAHSKERGPEEILHG
jgi:hypothetical protein